VSKARLLGMLLAGALFSLPLTALSDDRWDRDWKGRHSRYDGKSDHRHGKWDDDDRRQHHAKHWRHHRHHGHARGHDRQDHWKHGRGHWKDRADWHDHKRDWKHDKSDWKRRDDFRRARWDGHGRR